ncbi:unnamed protein product, partial [Closterium sp. NIES-54]
VAHVVIHNNYIKGKKVRMTVVRVAVTVVCGCGNRRNKVQVRGLDMLKFPNRKEFFVQRAPQQAEVAPVVIHNNYIKGKKVRVTVVV